MEEKFLKDDPEVGELETEDLKELTGDGESKDTPDVPSEKDSDDKRAVESDERPSDNEGNKENGDDDSAEEPQVDEAQQDETVESGDGEGNAENEENTEPSEIDKLNETITILKTELATAKADLYNFRQRVERDRLRQRRLIAEDKIGEFLPVLDNLDRALNVKDTATAKDVLKGVEMVQRQFLMVLENSGVRPIPALGRMFDPLQHDAVATEPVSDVSKVGVVVTELLRGYRTEERVLRPSQVRVGKLDPEKAAATPAQSEGSDSADGAEGHKIDDAVTETEEEPASAEQRPAEDEHRTDADAVEKDKKDDNDDNKDDKNSGAGKGSGKTYGFADSFKNLKDLLKKIEATKEPTYPVETGGFDVPDELKDADDDSDGEHHGHSGRSRHKKKKKNSSLMMDVGDLDE